MHELLAFFSLDVTVSLNQSEYSVGEQESSVEVCVSLSGPIERTVLVELASSPITANDTTGNIAENTAPVYLNLLVDSRLYPTGSYPYIYL